jgi:hypothetical protein
MTEIGNYEYDYRATAALGYAIEVLREFARMDAEAAAALTRILAWVPEFNVTKNATKAGGRGGNS